MHCRTTFVLFCFAVLSFLASCQSELHFPVSPSEGVLRDSAGECLPKQFMGNYMAGRNTNDSNFLTVTVHVSKAGDYAISSDTVNGFSFHASGNFSDTGLFTVKLPAHGIPVNNDTTLFNISYNNSNCLVRVPVSSPTPEAAFTLLGAPGNCTPVSVTGSFIKNASLGADDIVTISLQVSVAGSYSISTNEVNGYKFFSSGTVNTGIQPVTLHCIGAPLIAGTDHFTITAGASACSFDINVTNPVIVSGTDYFPLTTGSYWTYENVMVAGDTIIRTITGDSNINTNNYRVMHARNSFGMDSIFLFRRTGNDFQQYDRVDILTIALTYVPPVMGEINFLKQPLITGETWKSGEYTGDLFSGQPVFLQYDFSCVDANDAITINGNSFVNVYHIQLMPTVKSAAANPYNSTNEFIDLYYARGVGLVYVKGTDNAGFPETEWKLRYWNVN